MNYRTITLASLAAATIALAACNGGGHSIPAAPNAGKSHAANANATLSVFIPARTASASQRHPEYISPSTKGIAIAAFASPYYNGAVPTASGAFDVSSNSPNCSPAVSNGGSVCTFTVAVPAGKDDFIVTTYDTAPVNNMIPGGAKRLGYGLLPSKTITAGAPNSVDITLGGVVSKFTISMSQAASANWSCDNTTPPAPPACHLLHGSAPVTESVTVNAWDSSNNLIVANDGWFDANGNAVTVTLSNDANPSPAPNATPAPALGFNTPMPSASPSATPGVPLSSVTVTYATSSQISMTYEPTKMTYSQMQGGFGGPGNGYVTTITAQASSSGITPGAATISLRPLISEFPVPGASPKPQYLSVSPKDGKLWMGTNINEIASFDPVNFSWAAPYTTSVVSGVNGIAPQADGSLWFVEQGKIGKLTTSGTPTVSETPIPSATAAPSAIAQDSSGNIWYLIGNSTVSKVGRYVPGSGQPPTEYTFTTAAGFADPKVSARDMTSSLDGNSLWVVEGAAATWAGYNQAFLDQIDATGTPGTLLQKIQLPLAAGFTSTVGSSVTVDRYSQITPSFPGYGTIWVGIGGNHAHFAAYNPSTGKWIDYTQLLASPSTTLTQIAVAPDHTVWGTENSGGKIVHFTPGPIVNGAPTGTLQEFSVGTSTTFGIAPLSNGIWYTNWRGGAGCATSVTACTTVLGVFTP